MSQTTHFRELFIYNTRKLGDLMVSHIQHFDERNLMITMDLKDIYPDFDRNGPLNEG